MLCLLLGVCHGDSGSSYWKREENGDGTESVSTVLGVVSYIIGGKCNDYSFAHKVAHKDILKWISENWKK